MTAIFISHSSADNAAAAEMKAWLEAQGHTSLFLDFDPEANWHQRELRPELGDPLVGLNAEIGQRQPTNGSKEHL